MKKQQSFQRKIQLKWCVLVSGRTGQVIRESNKAQGRRADASIIQLQPYSNDRFSSSVRLGWIKQAQLNSFSCPFDSAVFRFVAEIGIVVAGILIPGTRNIYEIAKYKQAGQQQPFKSLAGRCQYRIWLIAHQGAVDVYRWRQIFKICYRTRESAHGFFFGDSLARKWQKS